MTQSIKTAPLDKPGAGLPALELFMLKTGFRLMRTFKSRMAFNDLFHRELTKLIDLAEHIDETNGSTPILVKRERGMEDSSRNWSAYMVFEHLHIVNIALLHIIETLLKEKPVTGEVKTEDVKPKLESSILSLENFSDSAQEYLGTLQTKNTLKTKTTHKHPWFGELDAHGWHALAAIHMQVHRKQLEQIVAKL